MNCPHCGAELVDGGKYCPFCGATASGEAGTSRPSSPPTIQPNVPLPSATGQIIFSIVNILCLSGSVFGIVGLVFSILAMGAKSFAEAQQHLRVARIVNSVGISIAALLFLAWLALMLASFLFPLLAMSFSPTY